MAGFAGHFTGICAGSNEVPRSGGDYMTTSFLQALDSGDLQTLRGTSSVASHFVGRTRISTNPNNIVFQAVIPSGHSTSTGRFGGAQKTIPSYAHIGYSTVTEGDIDDV